MYLSIFFERSKKLENWIATVVGKMHVNKITQNALAEKMGIGREYLNKILNGIEKPTNAEERIMKALNELISERGAE
jgi:predicted transcriptional regulator